MQPETIEHDGECTRLHVIGEPDGNVFVWLDTDIGTEDGICIGLGTTRQEAIEDAIAELRARLADLQSAARQSGR